MGIADLRPASRRAWLVFLGIGLLSLVSARSVLAQQRHEWKKASTTSSISVDSVFKELPTSGYAPLRISIKNGTEDDVIWTFTFNANPGYQSQQHTVSSEFSLTAKKQSTSVHDILVPLSSALAKARYASNVSIAYTCSARGFGRKQGRFDSELTTDQPAVALSKEIATTQIGKLNSIVSGSSGSGRSNVFGSEFDPALLSSDWRGYSGFDQILITETEWMSTAPAAQNALLEWVRFGHNLRIYAERSSFSALGIESGSISEDGERIDHALGQINLVRESASSLSPGQTVAEAHGRQSHLNRLYSDFSDRHYGLHALLGQRSFGNWAVALILLAFGIIVGPVNLFVFAKAGQRHRLFFTTPLISLIASALLIVLIFIKDGAGGDGKRFVAINLQSSAVSAYIHQEQVARTGVLFSSGFKLKENTWISPVVLRPSRWTFVNQGSQGPSLSMTAAPSGYSGDWFQSRREQGHALQSVHSTRARIELQSTASTPVIVSSLPYTLDELYYADGAGEFWFANGPVRTGQKTALTKTLKGDFVKWHAKHTAPASKWLAKKLKRQSEATGWFFASAEDVGEHAIDTLDSVDWEDNALVFGPVIQP